MIKRDWNQIARTLGYEDANEMLNDLYVEKRMTLLEIGKTLRVNPESVRTELHERGVQLRKKGGANFLKRKLADVPTLELMSEKSEALAERYGVNYVTVYKEKKRRQLNERNSRTTGHVSRETVPDPKDRTDHD